MVYEGFDFESYLISEEHPYPKPVCVSYFRDKKTKGLHVGMQNMEVYLERALDDNNLTLVAHNLSFELNVIDYWFPKLKFKMRAKLDSGQFICTMVYERLLDCIRKKQNGDYSLADLVKWYFKKDISESKTDPNAWRLRYSELDNVPLEQWPEEAVEYAIGDSEYCLKVFAKQFKEAKVNYLLSVKSDYYLNRMGATGFKIDKSRVAILETEILERLVPAYRQLFDLGLANVQMANGKDKKGKTKYKLIKDKVEATKVISEFYKYKDTHKIGKFQGLIIKHIEANIPTLKRSKKGGTSTDKEALPMYLAECPNDEVIKALAAIQKYTNIYTSFVERLKQVTDLVRSQYTSCVSTGRTSCRTSTFYPSVNVQQMPREV